MRGRKTKCPRCGQKYWTEATREQCSAAFPDMSCQGALACRSCGLVRLILGKEGPSVYRLGLPKALVYASR